MMGNSLVVNTFSAAGSATIAVGLLAAAASSCSFVKVDADAGEVLALNESSEQVAQTSTSFGIFCKGDFYHLDGDEMLTISRVFASVAIFTGAVSVSISWAICLCILPTRRLWQAISVSAALSAIFGVPCFLLFESEPCSDYESQQECELGAGGYLLMFSVVFFIVVTIITQCLDPPLRPSELSEWRVTKHLAFCCADSRDRRSDSTSYFALRFCRLNESMSTQDVDEEQESQIPLAAAKAQGSTLASQVDREIKPDEEQGVVRAPSSTKEIPVVVPTAPEPVKPKRDSDKSTSSGSLGSLEPTVEPLSGSESLLDKSGGSFPWRVPGEPDTDILLQQDVLPANEGVARIAEETKEPPIVWSNISGMKKAKRQRKHKGYAFMDDSDLESSLPISPPLEIVTLQLSDDFDPFIKITEEEQRLLDQWNQLHDFAPALSPSLSDEPGPEPDLSEDGHSDVELEALALHKDFDEGRPPRPMRAKKAGGRGRRKRRRRRRTKSSRSSASCTSLFTFTIEEETEADLMDSDASDGRRQKEFDPYGSVYSPYLMARSRSAPNLAGYAWGDAERQRNYEDLHISGMNQYHGAETWRTEDPSHGSKEKSSCNEDISSRFGKDSSSAGKKEPIFKEERAQVGIHAPVVTDESSSEGNGSVSTSLSSRASRKAREARIKRLKEQGQQLSRLDRAREAPKKEDQENPLRSFSPIPVPDPPRKQDHDFSTLTGSVSPVPIDDNYFRDMLDVQLAELRRPDGASVGPEEASL